MHIYIYVYRLCFIPKHFIVLGFSLEERKFERRGVFVPQNVHELLLLLVKLGVFS